MVSKQKNEKALVSSERTYIAQNARLAAASSALASELSSAQATHDTPTKP